METNAEEKSAEVVQTAAIHADAVEQSRAATLESILESHREESQQMLTQALKEVVEGGNENTKILLLQKIPLLCTDIMVIKTDQATIKVDQASIKSSIELINRVGGYILLGIGSLFLTLVGALLLKVI